MAIFFVVATIVVEASDPQEAVTLVSTVTAAAAIALQTNGSPRMLGLDYEGEPIMEVHQDFGTPDDPDPKPLSSTEWDLPERPEALPYNLGPVVTVDAVPSPIKD